MGKTLFIKAVTGEITRLRVEMEAAVEAERRAQQGALMVHRLYKGNVGATPTLKAISNKTLVLKTKGWGGLSELKLADVRAAQRDVSKRITG